MTNAKEKNQAIATIKKAHENFCFMANCAGNKKVEAAKNDFLAAKAAFERIAGHATNFGGII